MILSGILWAAFNGTLGQVTDEMLAACGEAVTLGITMLGAMCLWTGVLETGKRAGLIERLSKAMRPMFRFLFPLIDPGSEAARQICVNMTANFLGLGQAATPAGLKAMDELKKLEPFREDEKVLQKFLEIKRKKKEELCAYVKKMDGVTLNPDFIFDVQIKRLHE